ncbi:IS66 family transposase [Lignipirellula cremea]|uniref:IS66 family transposase n=1 Tax=Lignipirellula cremea TaxID=2528010 RepID=UPI0018D211E1|nr:transposase [Lignipirellula cremea]
MSIDRLIDVIASQQRRIDELEKQLKELKGKSPTERLDQAYSEKAEQQRQAKTGRRKRKRKQAGRNKTADKIKQAKRTERVLPAQTRLDDCSFSHTRVAWRVENGRAVLVAYEIYRCGNRFGKPAGLLGRSEFGIEIFVAIAYQVYCVGLSIDKACKLLSFFQQLNLKKSQADALLNQLARAWESEFDSLCTLLAHSAVVHTDETSWSINSVWAFLTDKLTVLFYGVHKDGDTLARILDKQTFAGVLISDDAAVYRDFSKSQKCWAHLIRKAIKLTLQDPESAVYRNFADRVLEIYRTAKRIKADRRLSDSTRLARVAELDDELLHLCCARWIDDDVSGGEIENDYRRLCDEIMRLMLNQELFLFVTEPAADGNNNAAERQLRDDATARKTCRTSKTPRGAKRRSVISSVLQSIGKQLDRFTLEAVIAEAARWLEEGESCFARQVESRGLGPPGTLSYGDETSLLDQVILAADA